MSIEGEGTPAVVLVCNKLYILPTLSTALSARQNISQPDIGVYIFVVDADPAWASPIDALTMKGGVSVSGVHIKEFEQLSVGHTDRHLPPVALARFFIHKLLPKTVDRFLYLDGDMFVADELDSLLQVQPPKDGAIVVADNQQMFGQEYSRAAPADEAYFAGLSVTRDHYFNSGFLYSRCDSWNSISKIAVEFLKAHRAACRSSDQSALNYALRNSAVFISQRYNYQSEHMMIRDPRKNGSSAVVYHFTGGPKPWDEPSWPWDESFNAYFHKAEAMLEPARSLVQFPKAPASQTQEGREHRARFKFRQNFVYPWRRITRGLKLDKLLQRPIST
jgi:lipopolysaccharide biosynthesis glycosyltransferase